MIAVEGCGFAVRGAALLQQVSVALRPGRVTAIVGPNGAGKSTLLGLMSGALRPVAGRVTLAGQDLRGWKPAELARRRAVVSQKVAVAMPMTARQVVTLGRQPWRATPAQRDDAAAIAEAMSAAGVSHLAERDQAALSGGEQQRLHWARALAQLAPMPLGGLLLLDEPTASLDLGHAAQLLRHLRALAERRGTGIALVLHDLNQARFVADDVVLLAQGRVVAQGAAAEVLRPRLLEPVYAVRFHAVGDSILADYAAPARSAG
ncbi:heme ABC transporter ATP-binding protein [Roseomonas sp. 18066]|uniref:heme ABC transporter ATP-binding protein n=1 Tax=Roseomonas sp. 18066 TaxID=2681412 RepID=UPI0013593DA0|nr:heme ABC transporter ATP-binding protein [Roseomonas sp. 18066]